MIKIMFILMLFVSSVFSMGETEKTPPNILFIFSDDQCWDTLGSIAGEVLTPNLDRLTTQGTFFENAYNSGAWQGAVCMASRTMLMTGKQLWQAHEYFDGKERNISDFWSTLFRNNGYETYFTGKWHISKISPSKIYSVVGTIRPGMPNYSDPVLGGVFRHDERGAGYFRPVSEEDKSWNPSDPIYGGFWEGGKHWSELTADEGVSFLEQAANSKHPFFMQIAFNAPHDPRQSPKEYIEMYPLEEISLPVNYLDEQPHAEVMELAKGMCRDEDLGPFPRTPYSVKKNRQEYFALITHMDEQIGRILNALEDSGKSENTIIIFTSDHGLACGQHGLMGKQNLFEHSVKPPLIIAGPGIPKDIKIDTPVYMQDIMPTSLEIAGISVPNHVAFKSLLPVLEGKNSYDSIYGAYKDKQRMVRKGNIKLIWYPENNTWLLFDLEVDPFETNNLSDNPQYNELLKSMKKELIKQQEILSDPLLTGNFGNLKE